MINNDFMSDDNKTNEELLEEVKKLRQLEEEREARRLAEIEKKALKEKKQWKQVKYIWGFLIIFFVVICIALCGK